MVRIPRAAHPFLGALALLMLASLPARSASTTLVVNEIQTGGSDSAAWEFVEIANVSQGPIDLSGVKLVYRAATSGTDQVLVRFADGAMIPAGGVLVYGGAAFTGPRDGNFSGSLSATGGGVALRDALGAVIDMVAYGTANNGFVESRATVAPAVDHSIHRIPCGHDADDNARDLQELLVPTPRVTCSGFRAPSVGSAAFDPLGVEPGFESTLTATISPGTYPIASVTADLSALGGSATAPLAPGFGGAWSLTVRVAETASTGPVSVRVRVADTSNGTGYGSARLYVKNPVLAKVVIHEVQTAGLSGADEEFVELYNRTDADVDLTGCKLVYRGPTSDEDTTLATFGTVRVKPHGYYLLGTPAFHGPIDAAMKSGLSGSGGGLALRSPAGNLLDSVGYGTVDILFVETRPAPAPKEGQSIERTPTGADTNDNAADFQERAVPTPTPAVNKPVITGVAFTPAAVPPNASTTITVTVVPGDAAVTSVAADLIVVGGETNLPLARATGNNWSATFTVAPLTTMGFKTIPVFAKDALGLVATGSGTLTVTGTTPPPPIKVNEVKTGSLSSGDDEFVELYNPTGTGADLNGWTVVYRSEKGTADTVLFRFVGEHPIAAKGHLLLVGKNFSGNRDGALASGLAPAAGSVGLRDPLGILVDSVGYGTAANALVETAPALAPEPGMSITRRTEGQDTDNNAVDFVVNTTPTPRAGSGATLRPGDANGDGLVTLADAILVLRMSAGLSVAGAAAASADVWPATPDRTLTLPDALRILRAATGGETL